MVQMLIQRIYTGYKEGILYGGGVEALEQVYREAGDAPSLGNAGAGLDGALSSSM